MKIGKLLVSIRKYAGTSLEEEIREVVTLADGDIRKVIARIARGEAKSYLDQHAQDHLDAFDKHAQEALRVAAAIAPAIAEGAPELAPGAAMVEAAIRAVES